MNAKEDFFAFSKSFNDKIIANKRIQGSQNIDYPHWLTFLTAHFYGLAVDIKTIHVQCPEMPPEGRVYWLCALSNK
ncbi:MAG: hypothetical protein KZQ96_19815 [Candidatus Thiodiazotropha sp. (ex Lucinoma borealis)]|nr:hypothetical protein [Candidatus Thiodiazotropha sp. (ex Lucinoma borealis)]